MANVWDGKHFWIWTIEGTLGGDVAAIIAKAKEVGARGVLVKSHDGAKIWSQFRGTVDAFKQAGLLVGAWGYHYGTDILGEARAVLDSISAGADWYVIDAEKEYEGKQKEATQLGQLIRASYPTYPIGYSSFPFSNVHTAFPYAEFSAFCDVAMPQVYWGELKPTVDVCLQQTFDLYKKWNIPVAPVGQTYVAHYVPTNADYAIFEKLSKSNGASGVSFWSMQESSQAMFNSVAAMSFPIQSDPVDPIVQTPVVQAPVDPLASVSSWALASVTKAIKSGLLTPMEDGDFHPKDVVTREMLATILDRAGTLDEIIKLKGLN